MLGLLAACLLFTVSVPAQGEEAENAKLDRAWSTWVKHIDRGRLPPTTRNWQVRGAILPASMRLVPESGVPQYTRLDEAEDLVTLTILRGSYVDGQRIVHLLLLPQPKRPDSRPWFPRLQKHVIEELDRDDLKVGIQAALLDKLEEGAVAIKKEGDGLSHSDPALASVLLPLLGGFHGNRFRPVLEQYLGSGDPSLILAAAEGLSRMGSGASIEKVLRALPAVTSVFQRRRLVRLLLELDALNDEGESSSDRLVEEKRWLGLLYLELESRAGPGLRAPLIPLFRTWRSPASVPRLIGELESTVIQSKLRKVPTSLVFYQNDLHETLMNLTGTFVRRGEWAKWRTFWDREGANFILAKEPKRDQGKTSASGFFGIPVRGKRVVFVLDTSGSMSAPTGGGGIKSFEVGRSRLERAKHELLAAVGGMSETSSFNVIFFSNDARAWLPGPRPANDKRKKALRTTLESLLPNGGTFLLAGLKRGMSGKIHPTTGQTKRSVDEIFVLSDGMPKNPPEMILERVAKWNVSGAAVINTVFLGVARRTNPTDVPLPLVGPAAFMKKLAEQNGGKFVAVD